jgi:hypothetical protein
MPDAHDPAALLRHAVQASDWRLVELIAQVLRGQQSAPSLGARRAYRTLVAQLGLSGSPTKYDRG